MSKSHRKIFPLLFLLAEAISAQVYVPEGAEFQIGGSTTHYEYNSAVAVHADGSFVVVWTSAIEGNYQPYVAGIRGRRFGPNAEPRGEVFEFEVDMFQLDPNPDVATGPNGDFLVVWDSEQGNRGQRFASSGEKLGGEFQVSSETTLAQGAPKVSADADGNFIVVWGGAGTTGADTDGSSIQGRRFTSGGVPLSDDFQINTYSTGNQSGAEIGVWPDGRFVVVWTSPGSKGSDNSGFSVLGQRFAADGAPLGGELQVNTSTPGDQGGADVSTVDEGGFVVVWHSKEDSSSGGAGFDIRGQVFTAGGAPLGSELLVNDLTPFDQVMPMVATDAAGNFVVAWETAFSTAVNTEDVHARQFSSAGEPVGPEFQVNSQTAGLQFGPAIAMNAAGDAVVTWDRFEVINRLNRVRDVRGQRLVARTSAGADFVWSPADPLAGQTVQFLDISPGMPSAWSWDFGDGTASDVRNPRHRYGLAGRYTATLTVTGESSTETVSRVVRVFGCDGSATDELCLSERRFRVDVRWLDFQGQRGRGRVAPPKTDNSGLFWFFSDDNWEMLVKVLDGCAINNRFWVFAAATTNVQYVLRVTDSETGAVREYFNPLGMASGALTDTAAFAGCP